MHPQAEVRIVDDVAGAALESFVAERPNVVLLTGGDTPRELYRRLAGLDHPWEEVEFFLSDERCVPADDERSNMRMIREALLDKVSARAYEMDGASCDAAGYEALLRARFAGEGPRFDMALYGLGPDAHTASLFPGRPEVEVTDRWCIRVPEAGWPPFVPRMSLTVPALSSAALGLFLVSGEDKREALRRLRSGDDVPAARMKPDRLVILADAAAAGEG
jgi:6-phosphogluconolactonase